jgi:hypothetical protein
MKTKSRWNWPGGALLDDMGRLIGIQQAIQRVDSTGDNVAYENIGVIVGIPFDKVDFQPSVGATR